jgi:hypothetical protein
MDDKSIGEHAVISGQHNSGKTNHATESGVVEVSPDAKDPTITIAEQPSSSSSADRRQLTFLGKAFPVIIVAVQLLILTIIKSAVIEDRWL